MPIVTVTKLLAVEDAKLAKLTADPASGTPTYAAPVDLPGIKSVLATLQIENKELRGDNVRLDSASILVGIALAFSTAKLSLDAKVVMMGGAVVQSGTTPAQKATYSRVKTDTMGQYKFEAKTPNNGIDTPGGDAHLVVYKLTTTAFPFGFAEEDYRTFDLEAVGAFLDSTGKLHDFVLNETGAAIV